MKNVNPLSMYLSDLSSSRVLSPAEETAAFVEIRGLEEKLVEELLRVPGTLQSISDFVDGLLKPKVHATEGLTEEAFEERKRLDREKEADLRDALKKIRALDKSSAKTLVLVCRDYEGGHALFENLVEDAVSSDIPEKSIKKITSLNVAVTAAKNKFAASNLRLVFSMARKHASRMELDDLVQEGNIGLIRSVDKFDHERGIKFSTYSSWWIRQAITRAIIDKSTLIRVPVHVADSRGKVFREENLHYSRTGERLSKEALMEKIGVTEEKLNAIRTNTRTISLDAPITNQDHEASNSLIDLLPAENENSPDTAIDQGTYEKDVEFLLEALTPTEVLIIRWRFSLGHKESLTLQEIADKFDLSRERIRQLEARALMKMRKRVDRRRMKTPFRDSGG